MKILNPNKNLNLNLILFIIIKLLLNYNSRLLVKYTDITDITPIFEKTETDATTNNAIIKFGIIEDYSHEINYNLYIAEYNKTYWYKENKLFYNWNTTNSEIINNLYTDDKLWKIWSLANTGIQNQRIITLTNLSPSKINNINNLYIINLYN
jgi:hypothetical protein